MRILITQSNFGLGGTETYSATVAEGLERLGHEVTIYAPEATDLGREMAARRGLHLVAGEIMPDDVEAVIAQDSGTAQMLAGREPAPRMIFVIHGLTPFEHPPRGLDPAPRVVVLNDRIGGRAAALAEGPPLLRMTQPIDLQRFRPRNPAPTRARRVLLLSNSLGAGRVRMLEEACQDVGLQLMRVGGEGSERISVADEIDAADIVVGYGRSVLEGMAMGRPAYVWERGGGDGWVTPESYAAIEADGFSGAATGDVIDGTRLREDLAAYRPELGDLGFDLVRFHHSADKHVEALARVLAEGVAPRRQDGAETISLLVRAEKRSAARAEGAERAHGNLLRHLSHVEQEIAAARQDLAEAHARLAAERRAREAAEAMTARLLGSRSWRLLAPARKVGYALRRNHREGT